MNISYSIGNDALSTPALKTRTVTQQTDSSEIVTETYKDINGRVTSTKNALAAFGTQPAADIWTKFNYSSLGELMDYEDATGGFGVYQYDFAGRKTYFEHSDSNVTTYQYDKASNLTKVQTQALADNTNIPQQDRFIRYEYDYNRLTEVVFPNTGGLPNMANVLYEYGAAGSGNQTGRLVYQGDATGDQYFEYNALGAVISNQRRVVGPNIPTRTFLTKFEYDSFNRLLNMTYPDGEVVSYNYDLGGNLKSVKGTVIGQAFSYVKDIDYDYFEQRTRILYGNNTETLYDYTPELRRLNGMEAAASNSQAMFTNKYEYDKVGNVTKLTNEAQPSQVNKIGGSYAHNYTYDNLNRLKIATGNFTGDPAVQELGADYESSYGIALAYNKAHCIVEKLQEHYKNGQLVPENSYDNQYFIGGGLHKADLYTDTNTNLTTYIEYDGNGNINYKYDENGNTQRLFWDEANRLRAIDANGQEMHHYIYDAGGERVLKAGSGMESVYENGSLVNGSSVTFNTYTTYPSAFIVVNGDGQYSKHYYAGSQRIVSLVAQQTAEIFEISGLPRSAQDTGDSQHKAFDENAVRNAQVSDLRFILEKAKKGEPAFKEFKPVAKEAESQSDDTAMQPKALGTNKIDKEQSSDFTATPMSSIEPIFFYHPDHLGTSTYLSDINGYPYQFFINLPFGESMAEQHSLAADYETPYKFNGKELDAETGLYYYGARYYDPKLSNWLSVDPLAERFPNSSPYAYCSQNPVNVIDPDGRAPEDWKKTAEGNYIYDPLLTKANAASYLKNGDKYVESGTRLGLWRTVGDSPRENFANYVLNNNGSVTHLESGEDFYSGADICLGDTGQCVIMPIPDVSNISPGFFEPSYKDSDGDGRLDSFIVGDVFVEKPIWNVGGIKANVFDPTMEEGMVIDGISGLFLKFLGKGGGNLLDSQELNTYEKQKQIYEAKKAARDIDSLMLRDAAKQYLKDNKLPEPKG